MSVIFDPLVALPVLWGLIGLCGFAMAVALWRGLRGWPLRLLAMVILLFGLANPILQEETRNPLTDIVIMVVDQTASQSLGDRDSQTNAAVSQIRA